MMFLVKSVIKKKNGAQDTEWLFFENRKSLTSWDEKKNKYIERMNDSISEGREREKVVYRKEDLSGLTLSELLTMKITDLHRLISFLGVT